MFSKVSIIVQMYYHIFAILVTFCHILHFILFVSGTSQMCLYNSIAKSSGNCRFCCRRFAFYGFLGTIVTAEKIFLHVPLFLPLILCASIYYRGAEYSAFLCFCAESWRIWRAKWYIRHAGSVVFTTLPAWVYFFLKKVLSAEDCAEGI